MQSKHIIEIQAVLGTTIIKLSGFAPLLGLEPMPIAIGIRINSPYIFQVIC